MRYQAKGARQGPDLPNERPWPGVTVTPSPAHLPSSSKLYVQCACSAVPVMYPVLFSEIRTYAA